MGLRADMQSRADQVSHTAQVQTVPPKHTTNAPTAGGKAGRAPSGEHTTYPQTQKPTGFTAENLRLHEAAPPRDPADEVEATAKRLERAAKDLGFDMPAGWRVGGLDDYGKLPMDRWLEGYEGVPGYKPRV